MFTPNKTLNRSGTIGDSSDVGFDREGCDTTGASGDQSHDATVDVPRLYDDTRQRQSGSHQPDRPTTVV